jgi:type VI secretion system secreted protein Hcp
MSADIFLKIDGIQGESKDDKHKNEIELLGWSWGQTQTGSAGRGGGMGTGKVEVHDINFTKNLDKATPKLMLACASGNHIPKAAMVMRKAGGEQKEYLKIDLEDVMVSSYTTSGTGGGETPTENVSLNFGKITVEYFEQDNKGTMTSAGKHIHDIKANTAHA